jgi:protein TonB
MFGDVVDPSIKMANRQGRSVLLTVVLEATLVGAFIIIPLMAADILPAPPDVMGAFVAAAPPPPPPPASSAPQRPVVVEPINPEAAPIEAPKEIIPEPPPQPVDTSFERTGPPGVEGGVPGGVPGGVVGGVVGAPPPPPPPPPPKEAVRVGGQIQAPKKIKDVKPIYPTIAQGARVQGIVIIEATIGPNGKVQDAKVIRSIPLLDDAAMTAVKQWEFTPTLLNGEPTPIIMSVTVNFQLN